MNTNATVWVADKAIRFIDDVKPLVDTDLPKVKSVPGVAWAQAFMLRLTQIQLPNGKSENIQLLGVDSHSLIGLPQTVVAGNLLDLNTPDAVVVDAKGLKKLGYPNLGDTFEINDKRARIVAIVRIPQSFQSLPVVYTTTERALQYLPPQRKLLSYILTAPQPGLTPEQLADRITQTTGLGAYTQHQFFWKTIDYFVKNTGIPINFGITVALGVLVGSAIAAQTFYTFTIENIKQFGTLKAMGVGNVTLVQMILLQSAVVGSIGYGLGVGLMAWFGSSVPSNSELAYYTPWPLLVIAFVAVVGVCLFASIFSIWRVITVEPALVFK